MADSGTLKEDNADSGGGWWGSWLSSAKSKSAEVYSMVKKDLEEVGTAVRNEASHVYSATSSVLEKTLKLDEPESPANVMKKSLSSFIGQVSEALNPEPDDDDSTEVILSTGDTTVLSTYKAELEALQHLDATFLVPADSPEYDAWKSSVAGDISEGVIGASAAARRLKSDQILANQYERLVPDAVDHHMFWERYLFRVALLQDRLAAVSRQGAAAVPPTTDPVLARLPLQSVPVLTEPKAKHVETAIEANEPTTVASHPSTPSKSPSKSSASVSKTPSLVEPSLSEEIDEGVAWEEEDFASDVDLTEEQQTLLLQEYEKEIASKKQLKIGKDTNTNAQAAQDNQESKTQASKPSRVATQTSKLPQNKQKTNNNKDTAKSEMNLKTNRKSDKGNSKKEKSDTCGNNLVEDHFKAEQKSRDDASSSNSEESWEKEFEIEPSA